MVGAWELWMDGEKGELAKSFLFRAALSERPENWHPLA